MDRAEHASALLFGERITRARRRRRARGVRRRAVDRGGGGAFAERGLAIADVLVATRLASSKGEAMRLVQGRRRLREQPPRDGRAGPLHAGQAIAGGCSCCARARGSTTWCGSSRARVLTAAAARRSGMAGLPSDRRAARVRERVGRLDNVAAGRSIESPPVGSAADRTVRRPTGGRSSQESSGAGQSANSTSDRCRAHRRAVSARRETTIGKGLTRAAVVGNIGRFP